MSKARKNQPSENLKRCRWFFSSISGVGIMLISFAGNMQIYARHICTTCWRLRGLADGLSLEGGRGRFCVFIVLNLVGRVFF